MNLNINKISSEELRLLSICKNLYQHYSNSKSPLGIDFTIDSFSKDNVFFVYVWALEVSEEYPAGTIEIKEGKLKLNLYCKEKNTLLSLNEEDIPNTVEQLIMLIDTIEPV